MAKKELSYEARELEKVLNFFFSNQVEILHMKFREPLIIHEQEYRELFSGYDSLGGVEGDEVILDQFTYDETVIEKGEKEEKEIRVLAKVNVWYSIINGIDTNDEKIKIYEIYAWREVKKE